MSLSSSRIICIMIPMILLSSCSSSPAPTVTVPTPSKTIVVPTSSGTIDSGSTGTSSLLPPVPSPSGSGDTSSATSTGDSLSSNPLTSSSSTIITSPNSSPVQASGTGWVNIPPGGGSGTPAPKNPVALTVNDSEKDDCMTKYPSGSGQENCLNNFYMKKAIVTKDKTVCDSITNTSLTDSCKNNLLFSEIIAKKDPTLCNTISNKEIAGSCYASIGRMLQGPNNTGSTTSNPCANITDPEIKTSCSDSVIMNLAISRGSATLCDTLSNDKRRPACKSIIENASRMKNGVQ